MKGEININILKNIVLPIILGIIFIFIEMGIYGALTIFQLIVCTFLVFTTIAIIFIKIYKNYMPGFWFVLAFIGGIFLIVGIILILKPNSFFDEDLVYLVMINWICFFLVSMFIKIFDRYLIIENFTLFFKRISILFIIIYTLVLFYALFFDVGGSQRTDISIVRVNLVPLATILPYLTGNSRINMNIQIINILANILLFVPMGFYTFIILNLKTFIKILILLIIPITVEIIQLIFTIGVVDVDDVILNFIGGILGMIIFLSIEKLHSSIRKNNTYLLKLKK